MASALSLRSGIFFVASLAALSLIWLGAARAAEKTPLSEHVIKEFGTPPPVPEGAAAFPYEAALRLMRRRKPHDASPTAHSDTEGPPPIGS